MAGASFSAASTSSSEGEGGKVTPVVDRTLPLTHTAEAIAHVGAGHARGKVAITVAPAA